MKIIIKETVTQQPNGDRATTLSNSSCFEVMAVAAVTEIAPRRTILTTFDQFDPFYCHIRDTRQIWLNKAQKYAIAVGKVFHVEVELEPITVMSRADEIFEQITTLVKELDGIALTDEQNNRYAEVLCGCSP